MADIAADEERQSRIAFVSNRDGYQRIYVMDADGGNLALLSSRTKKGYTPSWSPDGTKIAFMDSENGIFTVRADGTRATRVVGHPRWRDDREKVCIPIWLPGGAPSPVQVLNAEASAVTYRGRRAREMQAEKLWLATYQSTDSVEPAGYALNFAFHPGEGEMPEDGWLKVRVNDAQLDLLAERIDVAQREWQEVEIPLEAFDLEEPVEQIEFSGTLTGTFYLADLRLVTAAEERPPTAVIEEQMGLPSTFALEQNYPNPFNSATAIRFALPTSADVDLAVFNLAGQKVATLMQGGREAGRYKVRWDGGDDDGRALASGVYLYRLKRGNGQQQTRKLLLLR